MHRLLQGDVGSGKTIVALLLALQAIGCGYQVAFLAPTEVLADQHLAKCEPLLQKLGIRSARLSGGLKESDKRRLRESIVQAEVDLVFGTHALLEEKVRFANLGLAIVDEQHRFGVRQRLSLRHKREDDLEPHLLMMSATPIPRTLAMSYLADLDVSVIDELPPGRSPIRTRLLQASRRMDLMQWVRAEVEASHQVYWVCPLIEESEALDLRHAEESFAQLSLALPGIAVGLVHGRLSAQEKQSVMQAFQAGQVKVLVATTVIEVGVDVPQASLMVIEHAERFGLAQLHQLRGRVGRGKAQSQCVLLYGEALGDSAKARLKAIYQHQDGFEIAREDLRIRGPGEFLGLRQSGLSLLRYADLERDANDLAALRVLASSLLEEKGCDDASIKALIACWQGGVEDRLQA
jgi:ATP-dependent DNA helicase RecG